MPAHPLLLAAYPVLYLYAENIGDVAPDDVLPLLAVALAGALAALVVASALFRNWQRGALVASALVVAFFGYGHIARAIAPLHVSARFQMLGWAALVVAAVIVALRARGAISRLTMGLNVAAAVLVVLALVTIVPYEVGRATTTGSTTVSPTASNGAATKRDIYYLIFDRYGTNWAFEHHFGLKDNDLPTWLAGHGFYLPAESYANYARTPSSLASSLNMTFLDELTRTYGVDTRDLTPEYRLIRSHAVGKFLQAQGYRYIHLGSWWSPTQKNDHADITYTWNPESEFAAVLARTTMLPLFQRRLGLGEVVTLNTRHARTAIFEFETLARIRTEPGPKFVFAHVLLPHQPYVFRSDGSVMAEPERQATGLNVKFRQQLTFTNTQIRNLIARLLEGPEETRPIVIVQADEGPRPLRSDVDWSGRQVEAMRIRQGILNAIYFPGLSETGLYPTITPVNTFRLLFNKYFGAGLPLLPDRSYAWTGRDHAFDFVDVTAFLREPLDPGVPVPRGVRGPAEP